MELKNFSPMSDRVLVEMQQQDKTIGGIYIPDSAKEKGHFAKVIKCGPGKISEHTHKLLPMGCKPGDDVLIGKYSGWSFDNENPNLRMIHDSDVLAVL